MRLDPELTLLLLSPLFVLVICLEYRYWHTRQPHIYDRRDSLCNAALGLMHQGADKITWAAALPLYQWVYQHGRLFVLPGGILGTLLLFGLQDMLYYGFHRASHRVRWLWAAHSVHHSSQRMNFSTALRQSLMYPVAGMWLFWLPLAWIGFAPQQIITMVLLNLGFQFFVHTRLAGTLGPLGWVFNTPAAHRCHHAKNPCYLDRNYAGVLIIWDRLLGTYVNEHAHTPCEYGTVKPVTSLNPIVVTFAEWHDMVRELGLATGWRQRWGLLFASPERAGVIAAQLKENADL